ncbi:hypothetical protein CDD81_6857 [Ophiocordyceps australis]|uniref:GED domain-containing protein n=1 Tax=Ophiocordyceps australis TaxID=1399860 RepID=A0A2C5Y4Q1_9HYPO|nr:hypothetical protein CDD81_6857 [Ophiocordyceps australis]
MDVSLDSAVLKQLMTDNASALGALMGRFKLAGLEELATIPRIIVVGNQSTGKSSVLEAITHIRFVNKKDAYTHFATELSLHPAPETRITIGVGSLDESHPIIRIERSHFSSHDVPQIIQEAIEITGLEDSRGFSKDPLRIEVQGPQLQPVNVVDLPGWVTDDENPDSLQDKEAVDDVVESYMSQQNSIILVVASANEKLDDQVNLDMLKKFDPSLKRTMGIITNPELSQASSSDGNAYLQLVCNRCKEYKLPLGWHVLRNNAVAQDSLEERDIKEKHFFDMAPWNSVPFDNRGIFSLRRKLSRVIENFMSNSLSALIFSLETELQQQFSEMERLGKPRSSVEEMRVFLIDAASEFQRLARDGIQGRYRDAFFGGLNGKDHKLRAQLFTLHRVFFQTMLKKGAETVVPVAGHMSAEADVLSLYLQSFMDSPLWDLPCPEYVTASDLRERLQRYAVINRGSEYSDTFSHEFAIQFFRQQLSPWQRIAQLHVGQVTVVAKAFVDQLIRHVTENILGTVGTTLAILRNVVDPFFDKKEKLLQERLGELIRPYSEGFAQPIDAEFRRSFSRRSCHRLSQALMKALGPRPTGNHEQPRLTHDMVAAAVRDVKNLCELKPSVDDVVNSVQCHYEISHRTFSDNVMNLAIEGCLINDLPTLFTPAMVGNMTSEQLQDLVGEPAENQVRRRELGEKIQMLQDALQECIKHKPRFLTVLQSRPLTSGTSATRVPRAASREAAVVAYSNYLETSRPRATRPPEPQTFQVATNTANAKPEGLPDDTVIKTQYYSREPTPMIQDNTNGTASASQPRRSMSPSPTASMRPRSPSEALETIKNDTLAAMQTAKRENSSDALSCIEEESIEEELIEEESSEEESIEEESVEEKAIEEESIEEESVEEKAIEEESIEEESVEEKATEEKATVARQENLNHGKKTRFACSPRSSGSPARSPLNNVSQPLKENEPSILIEPAVSMLAQEG